MCLRGTFDPPTSGHRSVVETCLKIFDEVVVAVMENTSKAPLLSARQRALLLEKLFGGQRRRKGRDLLGRGGRPAQAGKYGVLRARGCATAATTNTRTMDYLASKKLMPELVELYIPAEQDKIQVSSTLVKIL